MITGLLALGLAFAAADSAPQGVVVHEWGTFTQVIDADGRPLDWFRPLITEPLPAFVHGRGPIKGSALFPVRMETPVIYFHTSEPLRADVHVGFPGGLITEFYPRAEWSEDGYLWRVKVDPDADVALPTELGGDHYYAARGVDSATLEVAGDGGAPEHEKFLFYRGVGAFELPLQVDQDGAIVRVTNSGDLAYSRVFLFERRAGNAWLEDLGELRPGAVATVDRAQKTLGRRVGLEQLEAALIQDGLFRDEAAAMIDTWRSSWFGDGLRLLFTLPREKTDAILPLTITPPPQRLERVIVGRFEIVTAEVREELLAFGDELARGELPDARMSEAAARFGRIGFAVLNREAALAAESQPQLAAARYGAADRFVRWQMESHSGEIGQAPDDGDG